MEAPLPYIYGRICPATLLLAEKVDDMAEKLAQPFTQPRIYMHLDP